MAFIIVPDANVLIPFFVRDVLLRLAEAELFDVRWSDRILAEVNRNLLNLGMDPAKAGLIVPMLMNAFPEAAVPEEAIRRLEPAMTNDEKDRHVLAAAVAGHAQVIVTWNVRDFSDEACEPYGIQALDPDTFLCTQIETDPRRVRGSLSIQAEALRTVESTEALLAVLEQSLPAFVGLVRAV